MPHKLYMCCDSNNCTCGRSEKLYGNNSMNDWQDKLQAKENQIDKQLENISTDDLQSALRRRVETEIQTKLKEYELKLRGEIDR